MQIVLRLYLLQLRPVHRDNKGRGRVLDQVGKLQDELRIRTDQKDELDRDRIPGDCERRKGWRDGDVCLRRQQ